MLSRPIRFLLLAAATAGLMPAAASAATGRVVYSCAPNLCVVAPDGSGQAALTTDATGTGNDSYGTPSLSADGTELVYTRRGQAYIAPFTGSAIGGATAGPLGGTNTWLVARMRPDGQQVVLGQYDSSICVFTTDLATASRNCVGGQSGSFGWDGTDVLAQVTRTNLPTAICLLRNSPPDNLQPGCDGEVLDDPSYDLQDPTLSPDGKWIAVTRGAPGALYGKIAIYDATSHALVREVSTGPDAQPAWSPDSSALVFTRQGGGILTAAVDDAPGSEKLIVTSGTGPTWGGSQAVGSGGSGGSGGAGGTGETGGTGSPAVKTCVVPRLTRAKVAAARKLLANAGCAPPTIRYRKGTRLQHGRVIHQSKKAKSQIPATTRVVIMVGR